MGKAVKNQNEKVGFKSIAYSVPESGGKIVVPVVKKAINEEIKVGYRTIEGTAKAPTYFTHK